MVASRTGLAVTSLKPMQGPRHEVAAAKPEAVFDHPAWCVPFVLHISLLSLLALALMLAQHAPHSLPPTCPRKRCNVGPPAHCTGAGAANALFGSIQALLIRALLAVAPNMINDKHSFEVGVMYGMLLWQDAIKACRRAITPKSVHMHMPWMPAHSCTAMTCSSMLT